MLKPEFDISKEVRKLKRVTFKDLQKATKVFEWHAEATINKARDQGDYTDRTGNLRHSLAWRVSDKINRQLKLFVPKYNEETQAAVNQAFDEVKPYQKEINMTIVAGMQYARYVEDKGYTVLTSFLPDPREIENDLKKVLGK